MGAEEVKTYGRQDTSLRDYIRIIFKHKGAFIITVLVLMLTVYVSLNLYTTPYIATVLMMKEGETSTEAEYYKDYSRGSVTLDEIEIVKSNPIIERTVIALGLYNLPLDYEKRFSSWLKGLLIDHEVKKLERDLNKLPLERKRALLFSRAVSRLKNNINVVQVKDTNMFIVSVLDFSPNGAVILANVISRAYLIYDLERQFAEIQLKYGEKHSMTRQVQDKINELQKYLDGRPLSHIEAIGPASVKVIQQAKEAEALRKYNKNFFLALSFLLSIVLGLIFVFGLEYLDPTIRSPLDIEAFLNIPFLGSIPKRKPKEEVIIKDTPPITYQAQCYMNVSRQINLLIKNKGIRSILVTDTESSKDTVAVIANIGICLAHNMGHKVLIIDANLRNPSLSKVFNITDTPGLVDVLEGKMLFEDVLNSLNSNLAILTAGQTIFNPSTLLNSSKVSDVIKTATEKYSIVFLSSADLKNFTDAVMLSSFTDAVVFVVNEGRVRRHVAKFAIMPLEQKKANLIGAILNNRNLVIPKIIYDHI